MSDETTLLPCPFCGGEARCYPSDAFNEDGHFEFVVQCLTVDNHTLVNDYQTEAEATAAWNARAERTCRMEYQTEGMQRGWWKCSKCGEAMDTIKAVGGRKPPRWCGNCGARVEVHA